MNFVLIVTDTQCKWMVGAYGEPKVDTPCLDRLASEGIRFDRAYSACPVCTPARGSIFSGLYPQCNGAWANDLAPHRHVPLMGEIFHYYNYRAAHTGKWHLDGTNYNGSGNPDGGFEPGLWYDRANYLRDVGPDMAALNKQSTTVEDLKQAGVSEEHIFGHRVADRAVDFLSRTGDEPFVLSCCFDEPHDPWLSPPEYWEKFKPGDLPQRPNFDSGENGKPELQQIAAKDILREHGELSWDELMAKRLKFFGCNSYIDSEIGRVVEAVDAMHADDTMVIYVSDHGDQLGSHGLHDKGAYMYEETCNVPFMVRGPGIPAGAASNALVSHLDILPTMLDYAGADVPESLHGKSLRPILADPETTVRDHVMVSYNRFQIGGESKGGLFPIRCMTDGRHKLAINAWDTDELYDLQADPYEMTNLIDDPEHAEIRNHLHDLIMEEMLQSRDPMWNDAFHDRPWRPSERHYIPLVKRSAPRPQGFPFQW